LRVAGTWFGDSPEGVFWPSARGASLPVFEDVREGHFRWEVTWRISGATEDIDGGLYVGLGVADC
jgi:hypothetical protein